VGEWHTQVDATCITAATMPRPTDRRLACGPVLGWSARRPSRRSSHRSHWSTAPTGAPLPPEHRSHWSTAPTGAPLPPEPRAWLTPWCVASADHLWSLVPRDERPALTVLAPPLPPAPVLRAGGMVPRQTRTAPPRPGVLEPAAASQRRSLLGHETTNLTVSKAELTFTGAHNH